jgi:hypothetical protein
MAQKTRSSLSFLFILLAVFVHKSVCMTIASTPNSTNIRLRSKAVWDPIRERGTSCSLAPKRQTLAQRAPSSSVSFRISDSFFSLSFDIHDNEYEKPAASSSLILFSFRCLRFPSVQFSSPMLPVLVFVVWEQEKAKVASRKKEERGKEANESIK